MEKGKLKREILEAGKIKIGVTISDFQERINELKAVTVGNDLQEIASQSEFRKDADIELLDSLVVHLDFAKKELETINLIDPSAEHHKVEFGSVVVTDKRKLFVSTGMEEVSVNNENYFGLSAQAPLYKNMAGCVVGDQVSFNGISYKILDIF